ncbi:F-box/kelch-repeat protein At3g23880-like [Capsicum annuum]|uniref:F-box/kelch-repeat protein At3g23880-like n=1 Tax=Capsicum annuum TaxID=4072 RepID=UPI001FB0CBD7|nr:F-box/kelch-repeat protein At3g23880-like [Capsicum annuum]
MESLQPILSEDITFEILVRLPVKTLLRMRSVLKSWLSLVSSPQFVRKHLQHPVTNQEFSLLCTNNRETFQTCPLNTIMYKEDPPTSIPIDLDFDWQVTSHRQCNIVGSCDGLLCLTNEFMNFKIWNPSTRELRKIPALPWSGLCPQAQAYGFVYNEHENDYKVVVIAWNNYSDILREVNFYSLRTNSWQKIIELPSTAIGIGGYFGEFGTLVNRRLHWVAIDAKVGSNKFIFSLDLVDAIYGNVALPNPEDKSEFDWHIGTLGGTQLVNAAPSLEASPSNMFLCMEKQPKNLESLWRATGNQRTHRNHSTHAS